MKIALCKWLRSYFQDKHFERSERNFNWTLSCSKTVSKTFIYLSPYIIKYSNIFILIFFSPHPYLFFNPDHNTMSFLGFYVNKELDLIDRQTKKTLETKVMSTVLFRALVGHGVDLKEQFDDLER